MSSNVLTPGSFIGRVDAQWKTGLVDLSVVVDDHALDVPVHAAAVGSSGASLGIGTALRTTAQRGQAP